VVDYCFGDGVVDGLDDYVYVVYCGCCGVYGGVVGDFDLVVIVLFCAVECRVGCGDGDCWVGVWFLYCDVG